MNAVIKDEQILSNALDSLNPLFEEQIRNGDKWENTNRKLFMRTISKVRGDNAELIIENMCKQLGIKCKLTHNTRSGIDSYIEDIKTEIKYASKGKHGKYCFNQIRPDEKTYDYVLFFFLDTDSSKFYTMKRTDLHKLTLNVQHGNTKNEKQTSRTFTMTDTKYNMAVLELNGDGTFEDAIQRIK